MDDERAYRWRPGAWIVRREVWRGRPWLGLGVHVVEDSPELLVSHIPSGAPLEFPEGDWPGGRHPWHGKTHWAGHGVLMLQRPGEPYAVWHFWHGPEREFAGWYLNLQEPFRRTAVGYDTQDLELDIWIPADGRPWEWKDRDALVHDRVRDGRFTEEEVARILAIGDGIAAELDAGRRWWSGAWAEWRPDAGWEAARLPTGWDLAS